MKTLSGPIFLAVLLALLLVAYVRHNNFPYYYQTDEPGKVAQVINGTRNYHHPLLLIEATALAAHMLNTGNTPQQIVLVGRWLSALAAAVAIAGLVLLTRRHAGWTMGLLAGAIAGLHPFLFGATHYMKEDCMLLAGLVWSWYGFDRFCDSQSNRSLVFAGVATGVAISGKYLGILALGLGIALVIYKIGSMDRRNLVFKLVLLCGSCALTFALINLRAISHLAAAVDGLRSEFQQMSTDRESLVFASNAFFRLIARAGPLLLLGAVGYATIFFIDRGRKRTIEWALILFALVYLTVLCLTPLSRDQYLIPVVALLAIFSVLGIRSGMIWIGERYPAFPWFTAAVLGCAVILTGELPIVFLYEREFARDIRREMVQWIRHNLPPDAVIAYEAHVWPSWDTQDELTQLPQRRVSPVSFCSVLKNTGNMKRLGITHVVAAGKTYRRTIGEEDGWGPIQRQFYDDLEKRGIVLWRVPPGRVMYLSPGLTVYALPNTRDASGDS